MTRGLNKVSLIGHLGCDPQVRTLEGGVRVAHIALATNEAVKGKDGQIKVCTDWHRLVLWARLADFAGEYLRKGRLVYAEGKLQNRTFCEKDGRERQVTEIIVHHVLILDN